MNILLTGGGTGGHTIPMIAIVKELRKIRRLAKRKDLKFFWLGSGEGPEKRAAQDKEIPFQKIVCGKLRRYFSFWNLVDFFKIPAGIFQSFFLILGFKPEVVFSKGGYVSLPVVVSAWFLRKKIIIHESDVVLGLANRIGARLAAKVLLGFEIKEKTQDKKYIFTGNPVRSEILNGNSEEAYHFFSFDKEKPVILITGGGQGARFLNRLVQKSLERLGEYQIIHLVGPKNTLPESKDNYKPYKWLEAKEMGLAYALADLVVARAGANTLAEIAALGRPSILIPLPQAAGNHQLANAQFFGKAGVSIILEQEDLNTKKFVKTIESLFHDRSKLENMGLQAKTLACPDSASRIAEEILKILEL